MENRGINDAIFWVDKNIIVHNMAPEESITIDLVNSTLYMRNNLIYNNSAGQIMKLGGSRNITKQPQICLGNIFWLNRPSQHDIKQVIRVMARELRFHENLVNNPSADVEIVSPDVPVDSYSLNCTNNWWGSGIESVALSRILDGSTVEGLAFLDVLPIQTQPSTNVSVSGTLH